MAFPLMTAGSGKCFAFPDVCKTPTPGGPVPIPYPNIAFSRDGKGAKKVWIKSKAVLRKGDQIRSSTGDEAGTAGGVVSNKTKGKATVAAGVKCILVEGKQVGNHTARTTHNGGSLDNTNGAEAFPDQNHVVYDPIVLVKDDLLSDIKVLTRCSPTFKKDWEEAKSQGYLLQYDRKDKGAFCSYETKRILISDFTYGFLYPRQRRGIIAHEVAHAANRPKVPFHSETRLMTQSSFAQRNTRAELNDEGNSVLREYEVEKEMKENCPEETYDIHGARVNDPRYREVVNKPGVSRDQKVNDMGKIEATQPHKEGGTYQTQFMTHFLREFRPPRR